VGRSALAGSLAWLAALATLSGFAAAEATATYDPLDLTVTTWPTPAHDLREQAPADGGAYFARTDPTTPATPIASSFVADSPFTLGSVDVTLVLAADAPVAPAQDANGNAIEVALLVGTRTLAKTDLPFSQPVLAPGATETLHASLKTDGAAVAPGDRVTVSVTPTLPALADNALKLLYGAKASAATFTHARVASVRDLGLDEGWLQVLDPRSEPFAPPGGAAVLTFLVHHDGIDAPKIVDWVEAPAFVVLRGDEPAADAHAHDSLLAARRAQLAHDVRVGGSLARIQPGVEVVVPVPAGARDVRVECATSCPPGGFVDTLAFGGPPNATAPSGPTVVDAPGNVLVPPPPATDGIAVSKDAAGTTTKSVPMAGWSQTASVLTFLCLWRFRRLRA